ncbi:MAG: hypothetical protein GKR91_08265 [Pseudomonadales bacterium]|nr:hypothetical protein [Pseudomonadales bacterium]
MPTNQTPDDAELSRLLSQAEPPKSPAHVDEAILQYARENAPVTEKESAWFPRPWATAVATLSIAAIAISVSLTSFNNGDLERAVSDSGFVQIESSDAPSSQSVDLSDLLDVVEADSVSVDADLSRERQVAQNTPAITTLAAEPAVATAGAAIEETLAIANTDDTLLAENNLVAEEELEVAFSAAAPTALSQAQAPEPVDTNVGRLENAVADTSAAIAPAAQSGLASAAPQQASRRSASPEVRSQALTMELSVAVVSAIDLPSLLTVLEDLLNEAEAEVGAGADADQTIDAAERASRFLQRFYGIDDETTLQQLEEGYAVIRSNFTDFELPETFSIAVEAIQQFTN